VVDVEALDVLSVPFDEVDELLDGAVFPEENLRRVDLVPEHEHGNDVVFYSEVEKDSLIASRRQ